MSRNNPIGQGGQAPWRQPADQNPFAQPPAAQPQQGYGYQQSGQGYYFPPAEQAPAPQPPMSPMPAAPQAPYPPPHQEWGAQRADPRGYDLGNYMPADAPAYAPAPQSQYAQHPQHPPHGPQPHAYGDADSEFDDMLEDEEESGGGRRTLMIVAALVGAIGLGGGLAYTYKTFAAGKGNSRPALVKTADSLPNKVKAATPGGKEFAHTDKKLLNRLGEDGGAQAPAEPQGQAQPPERASGAGEERDAPRKVRVIPMPVSTGDQPSAQPSGPPTLPPGVMLDNVGPPPMVRASAPPMMPPPSAQQVQAVPTPPVVTRSVQPPPVRVLAQAPPPAEEAAPPPPRQTAALIPPKVAVPKTPPATAAALPAAGPPQTTGTSGYVAVLSSQKSRMDALKAFADLQQKYGDVLMTRTPDVQEADLSARGLGTMYRLVVGPPGSRDAASGVCSQLKTAGYQGCWVTAY